MAQIEYSNPFRMEDATLKLGEDSYEATVSSASLDPTPVSSEFRAINGDVKKRGGKSSFVLTVTFGQDWVTPDALSQYLYENAGERVEFTLVPQNGGRGLEGFVYLAEATAGGAVNTDAVATAALQCDGKPTLTPLA